MKNKVRHAHPRSDDGRAFLPDPFARRAEKHTSAEREALAADLGQGFVSAANAGQPVYQDTRDEVRDSEAGGPFVETTALEEFAGGTDATNPKDATKEPFPSALGQPSDPSDPEAS